MSVGQQTIEQHILECSDCQRTEICFVRRGGLTLRQYDEETNRCFARDRAAEQEAIDDQ